VRAAFRVVALAALLGAVAQEPEAVPSLAGAPAPKPPAAYRRANDMTRGQGPVARLQSCLASGGSASRRDGSGTSLVGAPAASIRDEPKLESASEFYTEFVSAANTWRTWVGSSFF
jgi:hypothetical protein